MNEVDLEAIRERVREAALPPSDAFEARAERFRRATGMMAPGKDSPAAAGPHSYEERSAEWRAWIEHDRAERLFAAIADRAALLAEVGRMTDRAAYRLKVLANAMELRALAAVENREWAVTPQAVCEWAAEIREAIKTLPTPTDENGET